MLLNKSIRKSSHLLNPLKLSCRSNYYFLLPEIPSDTAETNSFMRQDEIPAFNEFTSRRVQTGFQKLAVNFELESQNLLKTLDDTTVEKSIQNLFDPLERVYAPVDYALKTARHLSFVYPYSKYHIGFSRLNHKMNAVKNERWSNKTFYKNLKILESNKHLLNEQQKRLLERSLKNCTVYGSSLNETDLAISREINSKIHQEQKSFNERLSFANKKFELRVSTAGVINELPEKIKKMTCIDPKNPDKGPWTITPNEIIIDSFMRHCSNRNLRKQLYESFFSRASYLNEQIQTNNSEVIKNLLSYRKKQAKFYGYNSFAEYVIDNNAATKLENVSNLFEKIKTNLRPLADKELGILNQFASKEGHVEGQLESYDVEFWKNKHSVKNFNYDAQEVARFFPYNKVLSSLFGLCKNLFDIEFKKDDSQNDRLWHKDVFVYKVIENGQHIGTLIIDPYLRSYKIDSIWSYSGRESSLVAGFKPLVYLNLNVRNEGDSSAMTFSQVKQLFSEFGKALQTLMAKTNYTETSDQNSIETDAANLTAKLFERFAHVPQILGMVSAHLNDGKPVPLELSERLVKHDTNFQLFNLMRQTFLSAFDLESHISEEFWVDVMESTWNRFMPTKLGKDEYRPCQFTTIFGSNFGCKYYSLLWSDMIVADIFEAFNNAGFANTNKLKDVGIKYKETFLNAGASRDPNELFRVFRGRNVSFDPFIKHFSESK